MIAWLLVACGGAGTVSGPSSTTGGTAGTPLPVTTSPTPTTPTSTALPSLSGPSPCPGAPVPLAGADLDLSPGIGRCAVSVIGDLGADGSDDLVTSVARSNGAAYLDTVVAGFEVFPDVIAGDPSFVTTSPESRFIEYWGTYIGLSEIHSTPDVTGDGLADVWLYDYSHTRTLVPGPLASRVDDPSTLGVATLVDGRLELATDLDQDGVGEVLLHLSGNGVGRCEGPFAGQVDGTTCAVARMDGWDTARPIGTGDVDADGVLDILVGVDGLLQPDGYALGVAGLTVLDGAFPDGTTSGRFTVAPEWSPWFTDGGDAALADFDGDGYADLVWVDEPGWNPAPDLGETAVLHGPIPDGADLGLSDATLHLEGAGDGATISGVADVDVDVDGVASLLLGTLLVDASARGVLDPADTAYVLPAPVAGVGEFDGDGLDDLVLQDGEVEGVWLFLGAYLP